MSARREPTGCTSTDIGAATYMPTAIDVFEKVRGHERAEQLRAAREADLLPYFRRLESPAAPVVEMEGAERIMLGSNNYLGLTGDPRVMQGARDALERYGTGLTGSRLLNGTIGLHLELERELAEWMGTEEAIVFTTGHQANVGTLGTILAPGDTVIADSADHASILDGCLLSRAKLRPFRHNRLDKLEKMLERADADGGGVLVVVDGVFSMEGDVAELPRVVELCKAHGARLMVDEAHAAGVLGPRVTTPIVPVVVGDDWKAVLLWRALYDAGVYVNVALHPAVPPAGALLRTSVMATHDRATLDRALGAFAQVKRDFEDRHGPLPAPLP